MIRKQVHRVKVATGAGTGSIRFTGQSAFQHSTTAMSFGNT